MRVSVTAVSQPAEAIPMQEVKRHLRVNGDAEDTLIGLYLAAAAGHVGGPEGYLNRSVGTQVLNAVIDDPDSAIRLPFPPVQALKAVTYVDDDGVTQSAPLSNFRLIGDVVSPVSGSWPAAALRIQYRAGYETIPAPLRAAILLMVGDLYHNRETTVTGVSSTRIDMSATVENLLAPFRVFA